MASRGRDSGSLAEFGWIGSRAPAASPLAEAIHIQINHRSSIKGQELGEQQSSNYRNSQRPAQFGAGATLNRQRQSAKQRSKGGHHDGPEAQQAGLIN